MLFNKKIMLEIMRAKTIEAKTPCTFHPEQSFLDGSKNKMLYIINRGKLEIVVQYIILCPAIL